MRAAVICFTVRGLVTAEKICKELNRLGYETELSVKSRYYSQSISCSLAEWTKHRFRFADALVFVSACGIAVRSIAPFVQDKRTDPAVLVSDECGRYVIPLLSGHLGGANNLAVQLAAALCAEPVITTATDLEGVFAVDSYAAKHQCAVFPMSAAKSVSAALLQKKPVGLYSEFPVEGSLPEGIMIQKEQRSLQNTEEPGSVQAAEKSFSGNTKSPDFWQSPNVGIAVTISEVYRNGKTPFPDTVCLVPKIVALGIGCKKGIRKEHLKNTVLRFLKSAGICPEAVFAIASIDLKKEEPALIELSQDRLIPFLTFSTQELLRAEGIFSSSAFVKEITGVDNVCERSAVCAAEQGRLIQKKVQADGITCALAMKNWRLRF